MLGTLNAHGSQLRKVGVVLPCSEIQRNPIICSPGLDWIVHSLCKGNGRNDFSQGMLLSDKDITASGNRAVGHHCHSELSYILSRFVARLGVRWTRKRSHKQDVVILTRLSW